MSHSALHRLNATDHCRDCGESADILHARGASVSGYDPERSSNMERNLTVDEVEAIVTNPTYDAFSAVRIYAIWQDQIVKVSSIHSLDRYRDEATRFYSVERVGVPIARA